MVSILIARGMVLESCSRGHLVLRHRGEAECPVCRLEALPDLTDYAMEVSQ